MVIGVCFCYIRSVEKRFLATGLSFISRDRCRPAAPAHFVLRANPRIDLKGYMNYFQSCLRLILTLACLALFFSAVAIAKDGDWRPPSPTELALKAPIVEKDADAEYLYWETKVDNSDGLELSHYVRVKIFTERGREKFATIDMTPSPVSKIKDVAARVIRPDGSIVELKKNDIYERTIVSLGDIKIKARSFAVPGIGPGVIVEYRFREVFPDVLADIDLSFQRDIPVQTITYLVKPYTKAYKMHYQRFNMPDGVDFVDEKKGWHRLTMNNVPTARTEPMMPPPNEVKPWVKLYYSSESAANVVNYWVAFGYEAGRSLSWQLTPNADITRVANEIVGDASLAEQKVLRIYDYCQTKIKNLSYDTEMTEDAKALIKLSASPAETLKNGRGWHPDIDRLFIALTGAAGLGPRLAFSGDRSSMFLTPQRTNSRLAHMAGIAIKINDRWEFFDPGSKFLAPGMLRWTAEGQDALLVESNSIVWTRTNITEPQQTLEKRTGKFKLLEDGTLEGDVRLEYTGHLADWRKTLNFDDPVAEQEENLRSEIKKKIANAEVTSIKLEHVNEPGTPFVYTFKIKIPAYAQRTGKRLLFPANVFERGSEALFSSAERRFDIYFRYPWSEEDTITIELPAGFTVENPEAPAGTTATGGIGSQTFAIGVSKDQKTLSYRRSFLFGGKQSISFPRSSYEGLRTLFDRFHVADEYAISLRQ